MGWGGGGRDLQVQAGEIIWESRVLDGELQETAFVYNGQYGKGVLIDGVQDCCMRHAEIC